MKNNGIIITLIIILTIIVFFLIMFLVWALNGNGFIWRMNFGPIGSNSRNGNIIYDNTYELENVKNINIKQDAGDIFIKETSNNSIQVIAYGKEENDISVNSNGNTLDVNYTNKHGFNFFNFGSIKNDIIIYIPKNYDKEIEIKNDYGNVKVTDIENATINVDSNAGNVEVGKIKDATIKCDYGNIEVKEILNKCNIKADCGNIEVDTISIKEDSTIKADLGNVNINHTNDIYIDASVDLGRNNISNNNRNSNITLKINCDCGNVNVGK